MAIAIAGTPVATATSTAATSFVINLPTGIVAGELLRIVVEAVQNTTITGPAGWTATSTTTADGFGYCRASSFHKIATGSESSTVTVTSSGSVTWSALAWRVSGINTTTPIEASATPSTATSGGTATAPSVTTLTNNAMVERVVLTAQQSSTPTIPAGHTSIGSATSGSSNLDGALAVAYAMQAVAGSSGTANFTVSGVRPWITFTISIAAGLPPQITSQPANQSAKAGNTATFSVSATGGTLSYQWERNTGASWATIVGATSSSYTTPATTLGEDGYQYRVAVTDSNGTTTSSAATLDVWDAVFDSAVFDSVVFDTGVAVGTKIYVKISGVWKLATPYVKISGTWKQATPGVKISGAWKQ